MKTATFLAKLALLAAVGILLVQVAHAEERPCRNLALIVVGEDDTALTKTVADFLRQELHCPVRILPVSRDLQEDPARQAAELAKRKRPEDALLLALLNIPQDVSFASGVFVSHGVAMVNIWRLRPADADSTRYAWRIEREAMRAVGLLLGAASCPLPRCALYEAKSEEELDRNARNFCPPCQAKVERLLKARDMLADE